MPAKTINAISLILIHVVWTTVAVCQATLDYPLLKNISPRVRATTNRVNGQYSYQYRVANASGALQPIADFMVEVKAQTFSTSGPISGNVLWDADSTQIPGTRNAAWGCI